MAQDNKTFVDGLIFKVRENAPDFVKGSLSVKVKEFTKFIQDNNNNGWVNIDLKQSKGGKYYAELNTYNPKEVKSEDVKPEDLEEEIDPMLIPF